jgi:hypothetical protein
MINPANKIQNPSSMFFDLKAKETWTIEKNFINQTKKYFQKPFSSFELSEQGKSKRKIWSKQNS